MGLDWEMFYTRNIYRRIRDCWNRPIASTPGAYFDVVDRVSEDFNWTFRSDSLSLVSVSLARSLRPVFVTFNPSIHTHRYTGTKTNCLNLGSYNYLGFAESTGPCADAAHDTTFQYGAGTCSPRKELGRENCHDIM